MRLLGIDENGLGPCMGPLVVTGLVGSPEIKAQDSKKIFKRTLKSYSAAESLALKFAGGADSFGALLEKLSLRGSKTRAQFCEIRSCELCFQNVAIPLWSGVSAGSDGLDCASVILCPKEFNRLLDKFGKKSLVNFSAFCDMLEHYWGKFDRAVCGNIGSTGRAGYLKMFALDNRFDVVEAKQGRGRVDLKLRLNGIEAPVRFEFDSDAKYGVVGAASIVGKYVRELIMHCISKRLRREKDIPAVTGYGAKIQYLEMFSTSPYAAEKLFRRK